MFKKESCFCIFNRSFVMNFKNTIQSCRDQTVLFTLRGCLLPVYWRKVYLPSNKLLESLSGVLIPIHPSLLLIQETLINPSQSASITKITHFLAFTDSSVSSSDYWVKLARGHINRLPCLLGPNRAEDLPLRLWLLYRAQLSCYPATQNQ